MISPDYTLVVQLEAYLWDAVALRDKHRACPNLEATLLAYRGLSGGPAKPDPHDGRRPDRGGYTFRVIC